MRIQRLMRHAALGIAATSITVLGMAGTAHASSTSDVNVASSARAGGVGTLGVNDCVDYFELFHYANTVARTSYCTVAALGIPDAPRAIALCGAGLVATGISVTVAAGACTVGAGI